MDFDDSSQDSVATAEIETNLTGEQCGSKGNLLNSMCRSDHSSQTSGKLFTSRHSPNLFQPDLLVTCVTSKSFSLENAENSARSGVRRKAVITAEMLRGLVDHVLEISDSDSELPDIKL